MGYTFYFSFWICCFMIINSCSKTFTFEKVATFTKIDVILINDKDISDIIVMFFHFVSVCPIVFIVSRLKV